LHAAKRRKADVLGLPPHSFCAISLCENQFHDRYQIYIVFAVPHLAGGWPVDDDPRLTQRVDEAVTWPRRQFLKGIGGGALAFATAGGTLAACSSSPASTASHLATRPKRGGTLLAGLTGGSSADTLDGQNSVQLIDAARSFQLYNGLTRLDPNAVPQYELAESIEPNRDATSWTIRLRKGVEWHDGRSVTADDIIFSLRRIVNPKDPLSGASGLALMDATGLKRLDNYTVLVPCSSPFSTFADVLSNDYYAMVPVGYDPHHPIGSGPFKFKSFTPGTQSTFVRNENYWETGLPYLDAVVINDYADETSQVNSLLSGQAHVVNALTASAVPAISTKTTAALISRESAGWTPFTMRVDQPPFNDVRVRQAMRLIVDRPEMRSVVFGGYGLLGNDLFAYWDPSYDHSLPQRHQDIEQARFLLKQAGHSDLTVTLVTGNIAGGTVSAATVFAEQAKAAGVTVKLQSVPVSTFYGSSYLQWTFAQDWWFFNFYLPEAALATIRTAPYNECHFANAQYNSLYANALAQTDLAKRTEIVHEMQTIEYNEGGYIIPYFPALIDGRRTEVNGLVPCKTGIALANYGFKNVWLEN
jgi:peptide/nickel transport system substrate-binding protein